MTKKISLTILLLVLNFGSVLAQSQNTTENKSDLWKEFISTEAGFKMSFPGEPTTSSEVVMTTPIKRINHRFEVSLNRGYFAVHFSDHPLLPKFDKDELKSDYEFLKTNTAKITNAEVISEKDVNLSNHLGREVIFKLKDEVVIVRFFVIDKRLYQNIVSISYSDLSNEKLKEEINRFFTSFTLIDKK